MSKTRLFQAIKSFDVGRVATLLDAHPELHPARDARRRNALHFLCGLPYRDKTWLARWRWLGSSLASASTSMSPPSSRVARLQGHAALVCALPRSQPASWRSSS